MLRQTGDCGEADDSAGPTVSAPMTEAVSAFVAGSATMRLDEHVRELARRHVLDTLASIVACRDLGPAVVARRYALASSGGIGGGATVLGTAERASRPDAAFASAMAAHGAEINDFMPSVFVQPGPAVISAALALGEDRHRSGEDLLRAVVAGYELAARIPRALGPRNLRRAGIANHGIGSLFGAAAAAASMARLDAGRVADVLACCVQQASGSWQWLHDVEHIEKSLVFAGVGARNAVQAVLLVDAGFRGVPGALDVTPGWLSAPMFQGGDADRSALLDGFDRPRALDAAALKRHPVGGPAQPAVHGLLALVEEVDRHDVEQVVIEMPGHAATFRDAAMPALNLRYLTALILTDGHLDFVSPQSLERMHGDEAVIARMASVDVVHDPAQEAAPGEPRPESARVTLVSSAGERTTRFVPYVRGYPSHPMHRADVEAKARSLIEPHLGPDRADAVVARCRALDELPDVGELIDLIAR